MRYDNSIQRCASSRSADETGGRGLLLVETLSHCWGVRRREGGIGKTVWAEVKAPGLTPHPGAGTEAAAVAVRAGRQVRVRGAWRTVRDVRAEPCASGGLVVTLTLDTGPALCLNAAEPLTVRDGAGAASRVSD